MAQCKAAERIGPEEAAARLASRAEFAEVLIKRLRRIAPLPPGGTVVEFGCAQGQLLAAMRRAGFNVIGIEPYAPARQLAAQLAETLGCELDVRDGSAEHTALPDRIADAVLAADVIEHVGDADAAFAEAFRVLRPGGVFWFRTASAICPRQNEIRVFPLFPWYPHRLKLRIMRWAQRRRPHLIGHTDTPAINWFTSGSARRRLRRAGFDAIYDRWDLRVADPGGRLYRAALASVRLCGLTRLAADLLFEGCAYAAVRPGRAGS